MQITAEEYNLLKHKLLPKEIKIYLDSIYRVVFAKLSDNDEVIERLKVRDVIKNCITKEKLSKLTDEEKATLIGLLVKCIKS